MQAVFQVVADGITVVDRNGRLVFVKQAAAELCGLQSAEEMLAMPSGAILDAFEMLDEAGAPLDPSETPGRLVLTGESYAERIIGYRIRGSSEERWSNVKATPHAYGTRDGIVRISGARTEDGVEITVRDTGRWRGRAPGHDRGRGLPLMRALADHVDIEQLEPSGTQVRLRYSLEES